jgi:hypothetical protein
MYHKRNLAWDVYLSEILFRCRGRIQVKMSGHVCIKLPVSLTAHHTILTESMRPGQDGRLARLPGHRSHSLQPLELRAFKLIERVTLRMEPHSKSMYEKGAAKKIGKIFWAFQVATTRKRLIGLAEVGVSVT